MEREAYIKRKQDDIFQLWLERATLWGFVLMLLLAALDRVVAPQLFSRFLVYRLVIASLLLTAFFLLRRISRRFHAGLALMAIVATAGAIELMILDLGGRESHYYVGMILLGISVTGFVPARFSFHVAAASAIYLIYLAPRLLTDAGAGREDFIIANVVMLLIFATMLLVRYLSGRALAVDLGLRFDLEQYRERLEEVVADRTAELAGAIERLRAENEQRKRTEEERRTLQEQLLQMQKMESIGRLAGGIAHDFNNMLTAIMSYTELCLMKLPEDHPVYHHLTGIRDASEKAAALTYQLLAFSRKQALAKRAVSIPAVVESMAGMLKRVIGEDIELDLDIADPARMVNADVGMLEQVIMNLAVNARDAMPAGGRLVIGTQDVRIGSDAPAGPDAPPPGDYLLLRVSDTGVGMPREVKDRIFEPFFTTKDAGKGTGLGLATVYGIVKQHTGHIFADSEPGNGTTFRVYLPAGLAPEPMMRAEAPAVLPRGSETVLLVEDDPVIRDLLRDVLDSLGYRVLEAGSGEDALRVSAAWQERIDLLLTDVVMPGMNGRELADALRGSREDLRVLYLSGHSRDVLTRQGILEQGAAMVHKPLTTGGLAQSIRGVLDGVP